MADHPLTFLLTDVEGSTRMVAADPGRAVDALARQEELLARAIARHHGFRPLEQGEGDSVVAVFDAPSDAIACALEVQRALADEPWADGFGVRVRMAVHTGLATERGGKFHGMTLHRAARIRTLARGGQILVSEETARLAADQLPADASVVDLGPYLLRDVPGSQRIFELKHPSLQDLPPPRPAEERASLTSFVGRHRELAELAEIVERPGLVTLVGAGGSGKTRLAVELADRVCDRFDDDAWIVDLSPLETGDEVAGRIAVTLGLRDEAGRDIAETLIDHLTERNLLLVLDNCEHVLDACSALAIQVVKLCAGVVLVATSRQPLGIAGENTYRVPPLEVPDDPSIDTERALTHDAVRLFVDRASVAQPTFEVDDTSMRAILEICRRLDGMPLAIELAASRAGVLAVPQILQRLDDRFRLLTRGAKGSLPRHRTLKAAVDWSVDMLEPPEETLFRRLSVFAGRFTLDAVEAVCAFEPLNVGDVLDLLAELVDRSLVGAEYAGDTVRYRMLQTIREYASERATGETDVLAARHTEHFHDFLVDAHPQLIGTEQKRWLGELDLAVDDLNAVFAFLVRTGDKTGALRHSALMTVYRRFKGRPRQALDDIETATAVDGDAPDDALGYALSAAGMSAMDLGDFARTEDLCTRALELSRRSGDVGATLAPLGALASVAFHRGDLTAAQQHFTEVHQAAAQVGHTRNMFVALNGLGTIAAKQARFDDARTYFREALDTGRAVLDPQSVATLIMNLGALEMEHGDDDEAERLFEEAITMSRAIGERHMITSMLSNLAVLTLHRGSFARSRALIEEALGLAKERGDMRAIGLAYAQLADIARLAGDAELAARNAAEAAETLAAVGARGDLAAALRAQAEADLARGRVGEAISYIREAVTEAHSAGAVRHLIDAIEAAAAIYHAADDLDRSIRLAAAADEMRVDAKIFRLTLDRRAFRALKRRLVEAVGQDAFDTAWESGRRQHRDSAVALALAEDATT